MRKFGGWWHSELLGSKTWKMRCEENDDKMSAVPCHGVRYCRSREGHKPSVLQSCAPCASIPSSRLSRAAAKLPRSPLDCIARRPNPIASYRYYIRADFQQLQDHDPDMVTLSFCSAYPISAMCSCHELPSHPFHITPAAALSLFR